MRYMLCLNISIRDSIGGGLSVNEDFRVNAEDFTEICAILGRFHELAKRILQEEEIAARR